MVSGLLGHTYSMAEIVEVAVRGPAVDVRIGPLIVGLVDAVLGLHGAIVYVTVGLLVLGEDAVFVGFVVPGETAAILGGVVASRGHASVAVLCAVVVVAAIVGDNAGYWIGTRYGTRLLSSDVVRRRNLHIEYARSRLARRGGPAVFGGRFIAFLRAVMPFLAGTSRMPFPRFLAYNAVGGLLWGVGSVLLGYLAGSSITAVERTFGGITAGIAAAAVIAVAVVWFVRRYRWRHNHDGDDG
jgi:membrane protein DedA with SNARE-associated domain